MTKECVRCKAENGLRAYKCYDCQRIFCDYDRVMQSKKPFFESKTGGHTWD